MCRCLADLLVAFRCNGDHDPAAGLHLFDVREDLLIHAVLPGKHHDGHVLVDKRDGPVLHLAGRIPFCVDIGYFLQLERPFERNRIIRAPAEVQEISGAEEILRDLLDSVIVLKAPLHQHGNMDQVCQHLPGFSCTDPAAQNGIMQGKQIERRKLRRKDLC